MLLGFKPFQKQSEITNSSEIKTTLVVADATMVVATAFLYRSNWYD